MLQHAERGKQNGKFQGSQSCKAEHPLNSPRRREILGSRDPMGGGGAGILETSHAVGSGWAGRKFVECTAL